MPGVDGPTTFRGHAKETPPSPTSRSPSHRKSSGSRPTSLRRPRPRRHPLQTLRSPHPRRTDLGSPRLEGLETQPPQMKKSIPQPSRPDQIDTVIAQLCKKNLPTFRVRLDLLVRFGAAATSGKLDEPTRLEALNIAHNLAGSLGMYGYQQGTEVASKMERILKSPTPDTLLTPLQRPPRPSTSRNSLA